MTTLQETPSKGNGRIASMARSKKEKKKTEEKQMKPVVSKEELVTPAIADRWLKLGKFKHQRKMNDAHVEELVEEMLANEFEPGTTINIAELLNSTAFLLTNGQHTLQAIVDSGKPQWLTIVRRHVKTLNEAGESYSRLDIQAIRRPAQRLRALNLPEIEKLSDQQCSSLISAIKLLLAEFEHKPSATIAGKRRGPPRAIFKSAKRWAEGIREYREPIKKYLSALDYASDGNQKRRMMRSSVWAVALATLRYQPNKAWNYWASMAAEDGLRSNDPEKRTINWLRGNKGGSGGVSVKQAKYFAYGWKAYFEERSIGSLRALEPDLAGVTIVGTPFKARKRG